jgi:glycosyltransferase involved in cell wall biosynthesis
MILPKVTIIIPVYNVKEFIVDCLTSVLEQDYKNVEVLIIDDHSSDNSIQIAKNLILKIGKKFAVKVINHDINMGSSAARNTGIKNASGDYIFFLDSDDILLENAVSTLVNQIKTDDIDIVMGNFISNNNSPYFNNSFRLVYPETFTAFLTESYYVMPWNKLIRVKTLNEYSLLFVNGICLEDMLFSFFLALYAKKIVITNKITYSYRRRSGSVMSGFNEKHIKDLLFILNQEIKIFNDNNFLCYEEQNIYPPVGQFLRLFNNYIVNQCYYALKIIFRCSPIAVSYIKQVKKVINMLNNSRISLKKILVLSPTPLIRFFFLLKDPFK